MSVVYLNHNRLSETRATTERLRELTDARQDVEVIAVDNGSTDGTAAYLRSQPGWLRLVLLEANAGIAGYNKAFERARGAHVLVLDDDSCPESVDTIDRAAEILDRDAEIGVIACDVVCPSGIRQATWHLPAEPRAGMSMSFVGCGFIIRRRLFEAVGWYPERFFLYQNEVEVAIRVRKAGFGIYFDPACRVVHRAVMEHRPPWRRVYFATRNTLWLLRMHYPQPLQGYLVASRLLIGLAMAVRFAQLTAYLRAARDGLSEPVACEPLSPELRRHFRGFALQNSLLHQLKAIL
jgi:GT2 family glycosyltransferase